jgi:hypothetical protein
MRETPRSKAINSPEREPAGIADNSATNEVLIESLVLVTLPFFDAVMIEPFDSV